MMMTALLTYSTPKQMYLVSLNAKIDQINIKLQQLKSNGHEFSAICLQETWLSEDSDISLLEIDQGSIWKKI